MTCTDASWSVSSTHASAGSDDGLRFLFRRVAGLTDDGGCALFAEGDRECLAKVPVLGLELAVSFGRHLESAPLRGIGCALPVRKALRGGSWISPCAESFDLGAQVGLVVEPGPGDLPFARHRQMKSVVRLCPSDEVRRWLGAVWRWLGGGRFDR